jgi:putative ABC transport system substrate-binding protein
MRRREFIGLIGGAATGWPITARAQPTSQTRRIGILMGEVASDAESQLRLAAFSKGLEQFGWINGCNISIETRWGDGNVERIRENAAELVRLSPDAILAKRLCRNRRAR